MVDKITQPITPVEEIEKINEIIDDAEASKVSIENSYVKVDLSNLSTAGQEILDNKLDKQMISNCITHIPQDIKLELVKWYVFEPVATARYYYSKTPTVTVGSILHYSKDDPQGEVKVISIETNSNGTFYTLETIKDHYHFSVGDIFSNVRRLADEDTTELVLKAGSKVYVPNGFEQDGTTPHFDEVIIQNDISTQGTANRTTVLFVTPGGRALDRYNIIYCQSGSTYTTDTTYIMWYDTTNNLVKKSSNSGSSWTSGESFPIAVCTETSSGFTSIDQIFNGFGFIGSTVFALPGVKFLVPNGRNPDGTLQNIESTLTKNTTSTIGTDFKNRLCQPIWFALNGKTVAPKGFTFSFDNYSNTDYEIVYDAELNKHFYRSTGNYEESQGCLVGFGSIDANSKFTTLKSKTVFHALDFNDKLTIVGWGRQFTALDKVVATGNGGIAGTYQLGFTDSNVKIGVFSAAIQTSQSGYSDMEIASDVLPRGVKACGTNNSFKSVGCVTIPFKRTITISFPNTSGGVGSGSMVNFEGYM